MSVPICLGKSVTEEQLLWLRAIKHLSVVFASNWGTVARPARVEPQNACGERQGRWGKMICWLSVFLSPPNCVPHYQVQGCTAGQTGSLSHDSLQSVGNTHYHIIRAFNPGTKSQQVVFYFSNEASAQIYGFLPFLAVGSSSPEKAANLPPASSSSYFWLANMKF